MDKAKLLITVQVVYEVEINGQGATDDVTILLVPEENCINIRVAED